MKTTEALFAVGAEPCDGAATLPIGQLLLRRGLIGEADLERGLAFQARFGGRIGALLVRIGALSESNLLAALSDQLGLPVLDSDDLPTAAQALDAMARSGQRPEWWLDQEAVVWENAADGTINCIARDPLLPSLEEGVERAFAHHAVQWWLVLNQDLDRILDQVEQALRQDTTNLSDEVSHLRELAEEAPIVELVANTLSQALGERASDIHFEPEERHFRIRYRIDGVLHTRLSLPRDRFDAVASRVKLLSGMDIAERRLPQDGRTTQRINGQEVDIRVSALPGTWGESLVLRLLPKERQKFDLGLLGMEADHRKLFATAINEPNGIILVTGPTGSGKSTTLYAALEAINDGSKKIITVEDPAEYDIEGGHQVQVHSEIGYSFARALRAILRQDPDIIMIGEIRDIEAPPPHASVLDDLRQVIGHEGLRGALWRQSAGCRQCQSTGYRGRLGIYETIEVVPSLQEAILQRLPAQEAIEIARREGFRSLRQDGLIKAAAGITSVDEVMRVTGLKLAE